MTLISFLLGLILAFMGAMQLQQFGAEIYVAALSTMGIPPMEFLVLPRMLAVGPPRRYETPRRSRRFVPF